MFWDPDPVCFYIPLVHIPVHWYSLFFALGCLLAYYLVLRDITQNIDKKIARQYVDRLGLFLFIGMLLGARLGHVLFYDWAYFSAHPEKIFTIPMRGLASHGAVFGIGISLFLFYRTTKVKIPYKILLDSIARAAVLAGACIRVGNFFNQEIVGTATQLPWGVIFGHAAEGVRGSHHPVQLYEAIFYSVVFLLLYCLRKRLPAGISFALCIILVFTFRFFIEYVKLSQGGIEYFHLEAGQLLSLPFILLGGIILLYNLKKKRD